MELRTRTDPRGELAQLLEVDPAAAARHIKRHAGLLFGESARRISPKHIHVEVWRHGMIERAHVRLRKVTPAELRAFINCPAARFLSSLIVTFVDTNDDAIAKVQAGRRQLQELVQIAKRAPCVDSLRTLHVRSIDPAGQPDSVLKQSSRWAPEALRSFRQLTDCHLVFDSETELLP